jgi:transposase-like protein
VVEQRYQAVLAVISDGETVADVAARFEVSRQTVHNWLATYEAGGLENLEDGSHRPRSCPHQMDAGVEVERPLGPDSAEPADLAVCQHDDSIAGAHREGRRLRGIDDYAA